ncbi:MAG TPA: DUF1990 domain-containing protein [Blastocatellia bacterium]|nr:DUF1990 domain-containing protein [Blastocatellia bacterium]
MFLLSKPSDARIQQFIAAQGELEVVDPSASLNSAEVPRGYSADHNRVELGRGEQDFVCATAALARWEMFKLGWLELLPTAAPIEKGTTVAVLVRHFGFWSLNACKVVRMIDEDGIIQKRGFVYGTLPDHAERGQEQFTVEWNRESNLVFYDIIAWSRPNKLLAKLGYPLSRALQKRFARDSMHAMLRAVSTGGSCADLHRPPPAGPC